MPELAAHLERVARRERLAQQWAQSWLDTQSKAPGINLGEMEQSLAGMLLRWGAQYAKDESAAVLAACAREAKLEEASELEHPLLAARNFVRGRHSTLTYGPRSLLERLDVALLQITKLRLEVTGERAVGEKGQQA